jgi:alkylated DNA repair dioxygenase AlkB
MRIEIAPGYTITYLERFYQPREADRLLAQFLALDLPPERVRMFGRVFVTKRRSGQYGVDFLYNPEVGKGQPWTPLMLGVREQLERVAGPLDSGLVLVYPSGDAGLGWHEDDGMPEVVASLSLGAERDFDFGVGAGKSRRVIWRQRLGHGSLLLIPGAVNRAFKHRVPTALRVNEPRVNVTLRRFP